MMLTALRQASCRATTAPSRLQWATVSTVAGPSRLPPQTVIRTGGPRFASSAAQLTDATSTAVVPPEAPKPSRRRASKVELDGPPDVDTAPRPSTEASSTEVAAVPKKPRRRKAAKTDSDIAPTELVEADLNEEFADEPDEPFSPSITLRPYQEEAIESCVEALRGGLRRIGVSSPTGSGKTTMFMHLIPQVKAEDERHQTLILVGSVELALQAEAAAKRLLGPEWTVEVEQSKRVATGDADVTIATYQTLNNYERLKKFDPSRFKLVIVDEAHHAAAISYLRLLNYFNQDVELPEVTGPYPKYTEQPDKVPIIGFSATFSRHDQLALRAAFEEIVFHREVGHMLEEGWLSPVEWTTVRAKLDLELVPITARGDFHLTSLAAHVNKAETNALLVGTWLREAKHRRSTLVFAVNLAHVAALVAAFRKAGVDARSVSAHTVPTERRNLIAGFGAGEYPVLVNCEVLTEGTDIQEIDCIILARPTHSKNLLAQMVGRGLRLSPTTGKENCRVIDLVDNYARAGGVAVGPTLLGLSYTDGTDREVPERLPVGDEDQSSLSKDMKNDQPITAVRRVTLVNVDDPFGLAAPGSTMVVVPKISLNAWVYVGDSRYVLDVMQFGRIVIALDEDGIGLWSIVHEPPRPTVDGRTYFKQIRLPIGQAEMLERALQTADQFVSKKYPPEVLKLLYRDAAFRKRPASDKQKEMLAKVLKLDPAGPQEVTIAGKVVPLEKITAGQVSAILVGIRFGAKSRRQKIDTVAARAQERLRKKEEKKQALAARNLPLPSM